LIAPEIFLSVASTEAAAFAKNSSQLLLVGRTIKTYIKKGRPFNA
jgi:hypothetical protein